VYYSDVIVPRDSDVMTFLDLRGRSWAYNEPLSHSGYGITRFHLLRLEETGGFFGEVIEAGFHEAAIRMVGAGEVDGSAIDSQVLSVVLRDEPDLRDSIRIVESLGPSTIQPVAISRRIPSDLVSAIVEVLTSLHRDPGVRDQLAEGLVDRFVAVGPDSYDDIRHMLEACEVAGFTELR
jgi:phosphonate transport system substrate-binding protein